MVALGAGLEASGDPTALGSWSCSEFGPWLEWGREVGPQGGGDGCLQGPAGEVFARLLEPPERLMVCLVPHLGQPHPEG